MFTINFIVFTQFSGVFTFTWKNYWEHSKMTPRYTINVYFSSVKRLNVTFGQGLLPEKASPEKEINLQILTDVRRTDRVRPRRQWGTGVRTGRRWRVGDGAVGSAEVYSLVDPLAAGSARRKRWSTASRVSHSPPLCRRRGKTENRRSRRYVRHNHRG